MDAQVTPACDAQPQRQAEPGRILGGFLRMLDHVLERSCVQGAIRSFPAHRVKRVVQFAAQHERLVKRQESMQHLMREVAVLLKKFLELRYKVGPCRVAH